MPEQIENSAELLQLVRNMLKRLKLLSKRLISEVNWLGCKFLLDKKSLLNSIACVCIRKNQNNKYSEC